MTMTLNTQALINLAHLYLDAAAVTAEQDATEEVHGSALAGQIQLAAATLPPSDEDAADALPVPSADVAAHLRAALITLDQIPPLDGPSDLPLCAWHVHELLRIATRPGAA